jgi:simple sugar transport system ATP-binding protein
MEENGHFLVARNISKAYKGVQALDGVNLSITHGGIHSLIGENGSGKSTLIKIISGVVRPDEGEIVVDGRPLTAFNAIGSIRAGIQVIYQDLSLYPNLTVAENLALEQLVEHGTKFAVKSEIYAIAGRGLELLGLKLDLDELIENLSMADRQLIAITRALTQGAKLIIMDEPTTALTQREIDLLFSVIRGLKNRSVSVLFVSHKLREVLEISDTVTVLRDGRLVGDYARKDVDNNKLEFYMSGREITKVKFSYAGGRAQDEAPVLEVRNLTKKGLFSGVSFSLHRGEILGIAGLLGSGRTELALAIFGLDPADSGEIYVDGKKVAMRSTRQAVRHGIGYLPEDRINQGLFSRQSIGENIIVTSIESLLNRWRLVNRKAMVGEIERWVKDLQIKISSENAPIISLSGGNQQRVILARWLATQPRVFIADNPTAGVDVASKSHIHEILRGLAGEGLGVILISDEVNELLYNTNRVLIMHEGRIVGEEQTHTLTEQKLNGFNA